MSQTTSKPRAPRKPDGVKVITLVGGTLADGTHFEEGDPLTVDAKQHAALIANGIIADPDAADAGAEPGVGS